VDDPYCRDALGKLESAGLAVGVWEITSNVGVPAFQCKIREGRGDPLVAVGEGCHPSRSVALLRALTEAVQVRLTLIAGSRGDLRRSHYEPRVDDKTLGLDWSWIDDRYPRRNFRQVPTREAATFDDDVCWLLDRLRTVGIEEAVAVDLTKAEFGVP